MNLTLVTDGSFLHVRDGMFEVELAGRKQRVSPKRVERILVATRLRLSSDVVVLALQHNIDVLFLDRFGDPVGRVWQPVIGSTSRIRRSQLFASGQPAGLAYARRWIAQKLAGRRAFLLELARNRPKKSALLKTRAAEIDAALDRLERVDPDDAGAAESLRGVEGQAGRGYFDGLAKIQAKAFVFSGRSFRPAADPFNCMLNYGYGVLYGQVEKACHLAGLDPHVGFLHRNDYNQRAFVYDFIEPYRVHVERAVTGLFGRKLVKKGQFDALENGVTLNKDGKKVLLEALMARFDQKVARGARQVQLKFAIQLDAHAFAQELLREDSP